MRSVAGRRSRWASILILAVIPVGLLGLPRLAGGAASGLEVPTVGAWTTETAFPLVGVVRAWGVFFPPNGKYYLMGGRTADTAGSDLQSPHEYDPVSNSWTTKSAVFGSNQVNNMVGGVLNFGGTEYIVVVGGSAAAATTASSQVWQYDPVADVLLELTLDPWPGNLGGTILPGGAAVVANKLYVFGSFDINVAMTDQIWRFDPAAAAGSRWAQMTSVLPAPRGYIPVASSGGLIYGFGGSSFVAATVADTTDSWRFDPVADTITSAIAQIPRATAETRAVSQLDGRIWVLGGGRTAPNPSNVVDVYDPVANSWTTEPPLLTARRNFAADINPANGEIVAAGGYAPTTPVPVTEMYSAVVFSDGFESGNTSLWSLTVP